jgi:hypothetical protein
MNHIFHNNSGPTNFSQTSRRISAGPLWGITDPILMFPVLQTLHIIRPLLPSKIISNFSPFCVILSLVNYRHIALDSKLD